MEERFSDQALGSSCVPRCVIHVLHLYVYVYLPNNISGYASSWNTYYKRYNESNVEMCMKIVIMYAAGTCITSDDYIIRDIHYNGNPIQERATVISRIAPTFIRYIGLTVTAQTFTFTLITMHSCKVTCSILEMCTCICSWGCG